LHKRCRWPGSPQDFWLISNIQLYLRGFLRCRKRPKTRKKTQKHAQLKHRLTVFTISALTMIGALLEFTFGKGERWIWFRLRADVKLGGEKN
jgi:hypothetical protein